MKTKDKINDLNFRSDKWIIDLNYNDVIEHLKEINISQEIKNQIFSLKIK